MMTHETSEIEIPHSRDEFVGRENPDDRGRDGDGAAVGLYAAIREYQRRTGRSGSGLRVAGSVLIPVGLVLISLGWYGVATNAWEFLQLPYLVSGGLLGLSLVVLGAGAYFAYWQLQLLQEVRRQTGLLERVERRLDSVPWGRAVHGNPAAPGPEAPLLVATATGSLMHLPSCPVVRGKDTHVVSPDGDGLGWCKVCVATLEQQSVVSGDVVKSIG